MHPNLRRAIRKASHRGRRLGGERFGGQAAAWAWANPAGSGWASRSCQSRRGASSLVRSGAGDGEAGAVEGIGPHVAVEPLGDVRLHLAESCRRSLVGGELISSPLPSRTDRTSRRSGCGARSAPAVWRSRRRPGRPVCGFDGTGTCFSTRLGQDGRHARAGRTAVARRGRGGTQVGEHVAARYRARHDATGDPRMAARARRLPAAAAAARQHPRSMGSRRGASVLGCARAAARPPHRPADRRRVASPTPHTKRPPSRCRGPFCVRRMRTPAWRRSWRPAERGCCPEVSVMCSRPHGQRAPTGPKGRASTGLFGSQPLHRRTGPKTFT